MQNNFWLSTASEWGSLFKHLDLYFVCFNTTLRKNQLAINDRQEATARLACCVLRLTYSRPEVELDGHERH